MNDIRARIYLAFAKNRSSINKNVRKQACAIIDLVERLTKYYG